MKHSYGSHGSSYGHKGMAGAYGAGESMDGKSKLPKARNPLKGKKMMRGPKEPTPSHKGHV